MIRLFIHLGGDMVVRGKEIIAILSRDVQESSTVTSTYLKQEKKRKQAIVISEEFIKSIVITDHAVYYSPVSSGTLKKRASVNVDLDFTEKE
ncbi:extracellular matrix/biofilm biosynthesis regulator RemA family protein [Alkalihalobacillus sp. 1P02AB]